MPSLRSSNAAKVDKHPLYSRPHRVAIPMILGLISASNVAILAIACISFSGYFSLFYIWGIIPVLALIVSTTEVIQRMTRTLGSTQVVVMGTLLSLVWVVYGCMGMITGGFGHMTLWPSLWLAVPGFFLNVVYLSFGAAALDTERRRRRSKDVNAVELAPPAYEEDVASSQMTIASSRPPSYRASEGTTFLFLEQQKEHE